MSRTLLLRLTTIMALLAFPATLRADQLGVVTFNTGIGGRVIADQVRLTFGFAGTDVEPPLITIFDVVVGPSDAGRMFSLNSGPVFEAAVSYITDGVNGTVNYDYVFVSGGGGADKVAQSLFTSSATPGVRAALTLRDSRSHPWTFGSMS